MRLVIHLVRYAAVVQKALDAREIAAQTVVAYELHELLVR